MRAGAVLGVTCCRALLTGCGADDRAATSPHPSAAPSQTTALPQADEPVELDPTSVPAGEYDSTVQTADTTPLEPDVLEHKYYAPDVGLVLTIDQHTGGREELVSVTKVSAVAARRAGTSPLGEPY